MAQHQIPSLTGLLQSDSAATVNAVIERDINGDFAGRIITASTSLKSTGSVFLGNTAKSTGFTADATATSYVVDTTAGSVTVTLPAAATCTGQHYIFKKQVAANSLIIDGSAAETIDGALTKTATVQYNSIHIWSDGATWWVESYVGTWT